jgi:hypothetical protein
MTHLQTSSGSPVDTKRLNDFTSTLAGIFNGMNNHFLREPFEFQNEVRYTVRDFFERFDAIFNAPRGVKVALVGTKHGEADAPSLTPKTPVGPLRLRFSMDVRPHVRQGNSKQHATSFGHC